MASGPPGRWQREYERYWRAYTSRAIAQRFGAACAQEPPRVSREDERELRAVLATAGITHVPPNHRRWQTPFPASRSQQDGNGDASTEESYVYSTPEDAGKRRSTSPPSSTSTFPAFSSQEMTSQATAQRRVSASQRLQMRMADMSPIAAARRSSTGTAGTISPASAAAKSPFGAGGKSPWTPGSSDSKKSGRRRSVGHPDAVELDVSMRSMQLSDDDETRIEEDEEDQGGTRMSNTEEMQVDTEGVERMDDTEGMQAPDGEQREETQPPGGEQDETLPPYTETKPPEGEVNREDGESVAKMLAFNSDSELEDDMGRRDDSVSTRARRESPDVEDLDAAMTQPLVPGTSEGAGGHASEEEVVQASQPDYEFGFAGYEEPNEEDVSAGIDREETQKQSYDSPERVAAPAAMTTGQPQGAPQTDQESVSVARPAASATLSSTADNTRPTPASSRKRQAPAASRQNAASTTSVASPSSMSARSHKRANRGPLLHTKLPLPMEYRFASDRRRRRRRRQTLVAKPAVFAFVVPELLVELQPYQQEALQWMLERELQSDTPITIEQQRRGEATAVDRLMTKVRGGILADEMGLGKTVCCLALICESLRRARAAEAEAQAQAGDAYVPRLKPPTLIVTPLSILSQWEREIRAKTNLSVVTYQGAKRKNFRSGAQFMGADIVLSTYDTLRLLECKVATKHGHAGDESEGEAAHTGDASTGWHQAPRLTPRSQRRVVTSKLHQLSWQRVILDESHLISNASSARARAAFTLDSKQRWCVTGTPIQNRTEDLTALLQFLGLGQRAHSLSERELGALVPRVVLRRLKSTVDARSRAPILELPRKTEEILELDFASDVKRALYMLLHRSTKRQVLRYLQSKASGARRSALAVSPTKDGKEQPLFMHVFELLLRLRQVCDACSLVTADPLAEVKARAAAASSSAAVEAAAEVTRRGSGMGAFTTEETALLQRLQQQSAASVVSSPPVSTKLSALMRELERLHARRERALVVSQWTSFLDVIGERLETHNAQYETQASRSLAAGSAPAAGVIAFAKLDDRMAARDRERVVRAFQQHEDASSGSGGANGAPLDVLLLSLRTGGLGLNLTAASHVFLMEPSWNPSLELQAVDRAHRFGQRRGVRVVRFLMKGTVEERVVELQNKKRELTAAFLGDAHGTSEGRAQPARAIRDSRLSRGDLRRLFFTQQDVEQDDGEDDDVEIVEPGEDDGGQLTAEAEADMAD